MAIFLVTTGLLLLGLAAGFFLAISFGIRQRDRRGGYRSLRDDPDNGPLSLSSSRVVNLTFRTAPRERTTPRDRDSGDAPGSRSAEVLPV